ncbi:MAG: ATP-grasp peptide maturase system methyltransferase [Actinoallomurus sp.]
MHDDSQLRSDLVKALTASGHLTSPRWRRAFACVPRHVFVPRVLIDRDNTGRYVPLDGTREDQREEWLAAVYTDDVLMTQLDGDDRAWDRAVTDGSVTGVPTSSSTQPALMALMLEALDVADGSRVLEIGLGTGYNAALLCEALGDRNVVSVDVDAELVESAAASLRNLGYSPTLAVSDGVAGFPPGAMYDRIIATCSLPAVPAEWLPQVRKGGQILVNLNRGLGGGALVKLTVTDAHTAAGRCLRDFAGFMPTRTVPTRPVLDLVTAADRTGVATRESHITAAVIDDHAFGLYADLRVPAQRVVLLPDDEPELTFLAHDDGSWACQWTSPDGRSLVQEHGPRELWAELEAAYRQWDAAGRPQREQIGLTVTPEGHQLWVGDPANLIASAV